jgi:hypothetical protein
MSAAGCLLKSDIRTVQELLGHRNLQTTMIYSHVLNRGGEVSGARWTRQWQRRGLQKSRTDRAKLAAPHPRRSPREAPRCRHPR